MGLAVAVRPDGLTDLMWRFVIEYLGDPDHNGTEAYKRAGYRARNDNVAAAGASELLKRPAIQQAILDAEDSFRAKIEQKYETSRERLVQQALAIAGLDLADLFTEDGQMVDVPAMPDHVRRSLAAVEIREHYTVGPDEEKQLEGFTRKVKLANRVAAIELAAKLLGYLRDQPEVKVKLVVLDEDGGGGKRSKRT